MGSSARAVRAPWSALAESAIVGGIAQEISDARRAVHDREEAIRMLELLAATTGQPRDLRRRLRHERREVERLRRAVARLERRSRRQL